MPTRLRRLEDGDVLAGDSQPSGAKPPFPGSSGDSGGGSQDSGGASGAGPEGASTGGRATGGAGGPETGGGGGVAGPDDQGVGARGAVRCWYTAATQMRYQAGWIPAGGRGRTRSANGSA